MIFDLNVSKCYVNRNAWHNVAVPARLCREATPREVKEYRLGNMVFPRQHKLPDREFTDFCDEQGIHVVIDASFSDLCSIFVPPQFAPLLKLRFDISETHI